MNNIKLDITKGACFLEAGAVKAFEPKVKEVVRLVSTRLAIISIPD